MPRVLRESASHADRNRAKPKLFGSLISEVLNRSLCTSCGGCVASCPAYILQMQGEKPTMKRKCGMEQILRLSASKKTSVQKSESVQT
jgi:ferredoxin